MIEPEFKNFLLRPDPATPDMVQLEWLGKNTEQPFSGHQLSDGTIRFICLATVLLQPDPPSTIIIDEPELGLHPYALSVLGSLLRSSASRIQLIVSTQSVQLINEFSANDIIVVDRKNNETTLKKLNVEEIKNWLDNYSISDLWEKNVIGGRPQ